MGPLTGRGLGSQWANQTANATGSRKATLKALGLAPLMATLKGWALAAR